MIAAILALAGIFVLAPGGAFLFDGLPVSGPAEFIGAAGLIVLAVSASTRAALAARAIAYRRLLLVILIAGLAAKAFVVSRGHYDGFAGCYEGAVAEVSSCAPSYDNPFRVEGATRIDPRLQFDEKTWRLGILNKRDFDFARDNSPSVMGRPAMELIDHPLEGWHYMPPVPFAALWRTRATAAAPATLVIGYVGAATVEVDGVVTALEANFTDVPATTRIPIAAGVHQLTVRYRWAPPVDLSRNVPKKALAFLAADGPVQFGTFTPADRAFSIGADAAGVLAFVLLLGGALAWRWASLRSVAVPAAIALLIVVLPVPSWWRDKVVELMMVAMCLRWMLRRMPILPFVLILATLGVIRIGWAAGPAPGVVHYRAWGDDGLSYDSFAREIFEKGTLRAGEDSFRGQPLFRYVRFVERVSLGEDEWLIVVSALVLFCLTYSWLGRRALDAAPAHLLAITGTTALLLWITGGLISFVDSGLTEYPAWILVPVITGLLLLGRSTREHLLAAALIGVGVLLRFNHLPAYLVLLGIFALRPTGYPTTRSGIAAALVLAAAVVATTMLAHNLYYGHEWRLVPDSAQINTDLPLADWTVSSVLGKIRYLLHIGTDAPTWFLPIHALQLVLAGAAVAVFTGRWRVSRWHRWLFLAPLATLAVHLVFNVAVYYPRHILFGYLLAGALVLVAAAEDGALRIQGAEAR
jgi:hypothetical protein